MKDRSASGMGVPVPAGDGGFPGTWLLEDRSSRTCRLSGEERAAACLRFLRSSAAAAASTYPGGRISGRILLSDRSHEDCARTASVIKGGQVEVFLEVPSQWLLEERDVQSRLLSGALSEGGLQTKRQVRAERAGETSSPGRSRLVQFIHCVSLFEERERRFTSVPPAAFCMAPALQRSGYQVSVDTLLIEPFAAPGPFPGSVLEASRERLDRILDRKPGCIALTAMDFTLEGLRCLLREIRGRDREVVIALGGPLVTLYPAQAPVFLEEGNLFIRGEADFAFSEVLALLEPLHAGRDLCEADLSRMKDKKGLFARLGKTLLVSNLDCTNRIESLDAVFGEETGLGFIRKPHILGGLHLHTTRGCPFRCAFCTRVHGSNVRAMSEGTIFRLLEAYGVRVDEIHKTDGLSESERRQAFQVTFSDDDFLLARSRALALFRGLPGRPYRLKTVPAGIPSFLSRGEANRRKFDPALFDALREAKAHIRAFEIGTDDFSERELSRLAKGHPGGYTVADIEEVVGRLESLGIPNRHFVILSNPWTCWSDLFEKLVTLEDLCGSHSCFYPDPNPFVLAPEGTPLFAELLKQGGAEALTEKTFAVPGFPEFTHGTFHPAPPGEEWFSTPRLSHLGFFRRLSDLLKTRYRFSIVDDAYLHFLDACNPSGPSRLDMGEKERILDQLTRAAQLRSARILCGIEGKGHRGAPGAGGAWAGLCGMLLLRQTLGQAFPEARLRTKRDRLTGALDAFFESLDAGSSRRADLPVEACRRIDESLRFGRAQIDLYQAQGCGQQPNRMAGTFVRRIEAALLDRGWLGEAHEWRTLCCREAELIRLEVTEDRQDARFVEDPKNIARLFELAGLVDPGSALREEAVRFLRAEQVVARSVREDFLTASETRVPLYAAIEELPLAFKGAFQQEFGVSAVLDKDGFVTAVFSKFLVSRAVPHHAEMHGTCLFQGLEPTLSGLVPQRLQAFVDWFFGRESNRGGC